MYTHLAQVAAADGDTPTGQGLLPTAVAEADIALAHARLAADDSLSLVGMRRHAGHVVHALDPTVVGGVGPGLGYGVKRAATEALRQMELAVAAAEQAPDTVPSDSLAAADSVSDSLTSDGRSANLTTHALHISTSLANAASWSDQAMELAQEIQTTPSVASAFPLVTRLVALCHAIRWGRDANGDGIVGWQDGEGGLAQATYHLNLLRRGEAFAF